MEGHKKLLGMSISENEGAKFWLSVLTELQNRGVNDILIARVVGLKGFPDAIQAVYPQTQLNPAQNNRAYQILEENFAVKKKWKYWVMD